MKEQVLYQCEICGTKYSSRKMAEECEAYHKIPKSVEAIKYRSLKGGGLVPDYVQVKFTDGSVARYKHE